MIIIVLFSVVVDTALPVNNCATKPCCVGTTNALLPVTKVCVCVCAWLLIEDLALSSTTDYVQRTIAQLATFQLVLRSMLSLYPHCHHQVCLW